MQYSFENSFIAMGIMAAFFDKFLKFAKASHLKLFEQICKKSVQLLLLARTSIFFYVLESYFLNFLHFVLQNSPVFSYLRSRE